MVSSFFKVTLIATDGGTMIDWSDRFSISGLTGTNPADIVTAVTALAGVTAGPAPINQMGGGAAGGAAQWAIPYNLQSGLTKWAPMQPIPPTKITAKSATPLFPTSAFTIATTWVAHPTIVTTVTQSQTFSVSSYENQVRNALLDSARAPANHVMHRLLPPRSHPVLWRNTSNDGRMRALRA